MYHVVLAAMLFAGGEATSWHHCHGCSGCYGCHGCCGGVVTAPSTLTVPPTPNATVDPSVVPQTDAERDAVRQYLKGLREKKSNQFVPPVPTPGEVSTAKVTVTLPADARLWVD